MSNIKITVIKEMDDDLRANQILAWAIRTDHVPALGAPGMSSADTSWLEEHPEYENPIYYAWRSMLAGAEDHSSDEEQLREESLVTLGIAIEAEEMSAIEELLATGQPFADSPAVDPLELPPESLNMALDNDTINQFILRKLQGQKRIAWMQKGQVRSRERVAVVVGDEEPDEPDCPNAQLPAGTPNDCFSALSMTENGIVDAAGEYQKCASILFLIPSGGAGEDELVCTNVEALKASMNDPDRVRYECTSKFAFTVDDPNVRIPIAEAQDSGIPFDLPQDSFDANRPYVPVTLGMDGNQPRNGFLLESEVKRLINLYRHYDLNASRLFTLTHKGTIPFTISRKLAQGGGAEDYLGASHCQYGSTIDVYAVLELSTLGNNSSE